MKKGIFTLLLAASTIATYGQTNNSHLVPKNTLEETLDAPSKDIISAYAELEPNVIADIDWLNENPIHEQKKMRDDKMHFVLMWMTGSPAANIQIDKRIVNFTGADPVLLFSYMTGWTKHSLTNNYANEPIDCTVAALENVVNTYKKNSEYIKRNKQVNKYAELMDNGQLRDYVKKTLEKK